jgi:hypothetical protein
MRARLSIALLLVGGIVGGCGPHYSIPDAESDNVGTVVSSGRSPQGCIENLHQDAKDLGVKVRLVDVKHEPSSGPISWIYSNSYTCSGKVVKPRT